MSTPEEFGKTILGTLYRQLARHLDAVSKVFKNPKVTLIVRSPELADGDVVIGDDDLDEAIKAIERAKKRPPCVERKTK